MNNEPVLKVHTIPQDINLEDKVLGPFTTTEALVLGFGLMLIMLIYLTGIFPLPIFIALATLIALTTLAIARIRITDEGQIRVKIGNLSVHGEMIPSHLFRILNFHVLHSRVSPWANRSGAAKLPKGQTPAQMSILPVRIINNVVQTKHGYFAMVLECSSVNIDLLSEHEKAATESLYAHFLNTLKFPIAIYSLAAPPRMEEYFERLEQRESREENPLIRQMMKNYRLELAKLLEDGKIMSRKLYVVVSLKPEVNGKGNKRGELRDFGRVRDELFSRTAAVSKQLKQFGVHARVLEEQELIELYHWLYNRDLYRKQPVRSSQIPKTVAVHHEKEVKNIHV